MSARLIGVGMGPGDPELLTLKAVRVLNEADHVLVPVMHADEAGRAEATVRAHLNHERVRRVVFALNERHDRARREAAWDEAARVTLELFDAGAQTIAFATIGDPNIYSTFSYLARTVQDQRPQVRIQTVPGITAMQALAAEGPTVLCEGTESLTLLPITAGVDAFSAALRHSDTVVAYKGGRHLPELCSELKAQDRLETAVFGRDLGLPEQDVRPLSEVSQSAPYLSTVIAPAVRDARGGRL